MAKAFLSQKDNAGGTRVVNFKLYFRRMTVKNSTIWAQIVRIVQRNRVDYSEISKEETQMVNKHMETTSNILHIRELLTKTMWNSISFKLHWQWSNKQQILMRMLRGQYLCKILGDNLSIVSAKKQCTRFSEKVGCGGSNLQSQHRVDWMK